MSSIAAEIGEQLVTSGGENLIKEGAAHLVGASHQCVAETVKATAGAAASLVGTYAAGHVGACGACATAVGAGHAGVGIGSALVGVACTHPLIALGVGAVTLWCLYSAARENA